VTGEGLKRSAASQTPSDNSQEKKNGATPIADHKMESSFTPKIVGILEVRSRGLR
jgi:hypothetical protein